MFATEHFSSVSVPVTPPSPQFIGNISLVFSALDRERAGTVAPEDFLHAIMTFYSRDLGAGTATAAIEGERVDSRATGLMELRKQYQAAVS